MSYLFYDCLSLETLDLSNFNTQNVEKIDFMFHFMFHFPFLRCHLSTHSSTNSLVQMYFVGHSQPTYHHSCDTRLTLALPSHILQSANSIFSNSSSVTTSLLVFSLRYDAQRPNAQERQQRKAISNAASNNQSPIIVTHLLPAPLAAFSEAQTSPSSASCAFLSAGSHRYIQSSAARPWTASCDFYRPCSHLIPA